MLKLAQHLIEMGSKYPAILPQILEFLDAMDKSWVLEEFFKRHASLKRFGNLNVKWASYSYTNQPASKYAHGAITLYPEFMTLTESEQDLEFAKALGAHVLQEFGEASMLSLCGNLGIDPWDAEHFPYESLTIQDAFCKVFAASHLKISELDFRWKSLVDHVQTTRKVAASAYTLIFEEGEYSASNLLEECDVQMSPSTAFHAGALVGIKGSEFLVGCVFVTESPSSHYNFEVCVHEGYQRAGISTTLTSIALDHYEDYCKVLPNLPLVLSYVDEALRVQMTSRGYQKVGSGTDTHIWCA